MEAKRLKQFTFYDLYYEALKGLPDEVAGRMAKNICRFMFTKEANLKSGLYLKKKFLEILLGTDLAIVWIGLGEKQHLFDGWGMESGQVWNELSSLIYYDENENLVEVNHSSAKGQERL